MNKTRLSKLLYVGLLVMLTACQAVGQPRRSEMFRPGDTIDGMTLTTGAADAPPLWAFCSPAQHSGNSTISDCSVPMIHKLAIGPILMPGDDAMSMLDWSETSWELTIDGQSLDLNSFGTYNFVLPAMSHSPSPIREVFVQSTAWDVVLTNLNPGEHTIHGMARMGSESYNWVIHLSIEGNDLGTGALWVGPEIQGTS
jgi:hypothetical protein